MNKWIHGVANRNCMSKLVNQLTHTTNTLDRAHGWVNGPIADFNSWSRGITGG